MSTYGVGLTDGGNLIAGANLSGNQFCAVKANATDRTLVLASTGGEAITGILQNQPLAGQAAEVTFDGLTKAQIGAAVTAGQSLMTQAATGLLIPWTSSNVVVAVAHESGASGNIILVRVIPSAG